MTRTHNLFILFLLTATTLSFGQEKKIRVAAASDLKFAMDSLITAFQKKNSGEVEATYGSSGKFHEQIRHGAPLDVFFSADIAYPTKLMESNLASSEVYAYAKGRIVLWSKTLDPTVSGMRTLEDASIKKIAIANPKHAPYGQRAMESIEHAKLKSSINTKLVYGENISQTAQFVATGAADIGVIALSLAVAPTMRTQGRYYIIPEHTHKPLIQGAIITAYGKGKQLAASFLDFVKSSEGMSILAHFGFTKP
ncbi:molybdate ABC transporter substrate-binding protein [Pseudochryseolinea flava]|uniref:Molybdate ABC transporter substrate-binding protein n=1 Tax=Pseudochryseolinea flava TaxID=2059302 RepID=A0A364Y7Z2_9BACT|nr:molybdate ABC transporter substrate-binding protein [Pseudochryseolinea flava]RAW02371.1 molybdate ABC transporter substrate-binding protein [Pseudochryseolinea flava]